MIIALFSKKLLSQKDLMYYIVMTNRDLQFNLLLVSENKIFAL